MSKLLWFACGVLAACVIAVAAGRVTLRQSRGMSAREVPMDVERWVAGWARTAALPSGAKTRTNPIAENAEVLAAARAQWADHCAVCHANDGGGTQMGKRMYPPAPDMRLPNTQQLTDGELFYIVQNGIRLTGMPAWSGSEHDEEDSWKLVRFIRHLPLLSIEEKKQMEKLNPKGPDDRQEELEEEKFLKGEEINDTQTEHHHH